MLNIPSKQGSAGDAGPAGRLGIFAGLSLFVAHFSLLWMLRAKRICKVLRKPGLFNKLSLSSSVHISSPDIKNKHKPWVTIHELDHMVASEIHFVFSFLFTLEIICFVFLLHLFLDVKQKGKELGAVSSAAWAQRPEVLREDISCEDVKVRMRSKLLSWLHSQTFYRILVQQQSLAGGGGEEPGTVISSGHTLLGLQQHMQRRAAKVLWSKGKKMTDNTRLVQRN